jgi:hypothetical protein
MSLQHTIEVSLSESTNPYRLVERGWVEVHEFPPEGASTTVQGTTGALAKKGESTAVAIKSHKTDTTQRR